MHFFQIGRRTARCHRAALIQRVVEVLETRVLLADGITPLGAPQINGTVGVALNNVTVATFTIADATGSPGSKWNAEINWGDGSPVSKRVATTPLANGVFAFEGSHTYATTGTFTITTMIAVPTSHLPNDNTVTTSAVIVAAAPTLSSIAVTPANPSIVKGNTQQFTATGTFSDNSTKDLTSQVTWASATPAVATITAAGLATGAGVGTSKITATLGGTVGSTVLTVTAAALKSIAVTPANPSVAKGNTLQFTATGTFSDNSTQNLTSQVTWASATPAVATITAGGLATGVAPGTSSISATLGSTVGSTVLTVTAAALKSIAVTPANPSVAKGKTEQFTATGTFSDNSTQNLTSQVTWASATPAVATINSAGLATTLAQGTSSISATLGGLAGSTVLTVVAPALVSLAVTPVSPTIVKGTTQQFTATGTFTDNSTQNLTSQVAWASATPSVATITAGGLATGVAPGTSSISATLGSTVGSTVLTVSAAVLQSIAVTPANPSVAKGNTQQFTATGTFSDNSTQNLTSQVTWASATPAVATITAGGLATGVTPGTSSISATLGSTVGSTVLTVTAAALKSIAVTPANPSVSKGLTQQFTATGSFTDNSTQDVTSQVAWTSAKSAVATITSSGLASAVGVGTSTITATLGAISGSTVMTVLASVLQSITVTPANPSIAKGLTQQFKATGTFADASTQDLSSQVTWASTAPQVATINATGLATGAAVGTAGISATLGAVSGSTVLTVSPAALVSIAVTPVNPTIAEGGTRQFTATGTFTDSSHQDITNQVTWASSNPAVSTITSTGLATVVSPGVSTISATLNGETGSSVLTATAILQSINVTPANPSLAAGSTRQFTATGSFSDGTTLNLTSQVAWSSGTPAVGSISATGLATGIAQGTTIITATFGGVAGSTTLTVSPATLVSIAVTPANPTIPKDAKEQFAATATFTDHSTLDVTSQVSWDSGSPSVATISTTGLAQGVSQGTTTIHATLDGVTGSSLLSVGPASVKSIAISPGTGVAFSKGLKQQFTATATLTDNSTVNVTGQVTWASSNTAVATIDSAGLAVGLAQGTATIKATFNGVSTSTILTVAPAALVSIAVIPANPSIAQGTTEQFTAIGTFSDNSTADLTGQVAWVSTNSAAASVSSSGLALGVGQGTTVIGSMLDGIVGGSLLTVGPATLLNVTAVERFGFHEQPTILVLSFNEPLDPARAQSASNYQIVTLGGRGRGGSHIGQVTPVARAIYDPLNSTVILLPAKRLDLHNLYRLTVNGAPPNGLTDSHENPLDGSGNHQPGSNFVTVISGKTFAGSERAFLGTLPGATHKASTPAKSQQPVAHAVDALAVSGRLVVNRRASSHATPRKTSHG
jgi:trimeric autotransporter adhesin